MTHSIAAKQVVFDFMEDFLAAKERLQAFLDDE
jgi:hypothetical protein